MIDELQELLKTHSTLKIYVDSQELWIKEIEKVYNEKWFLANHPSGQPGYLVNIDRVSCVEL